MTDWQANKALMRAVDHFMKEAGPAADNLAHEIAAAYGGDQMPDLLNSVMAYLAYMECYLAAEGEPHIRLQVAFQDVIGLPFVQALASRAMGERIA